MPILTIAGLVGIEVLAEELKEPTKKALGWLFQKENTNMTPIKFIF